MAGGIWESVQGELGGIAAMKICGGSDTDRGGG